ncbi:HPP family protein [Enterobacter mori]
MADGSFRGKLRAGIWSTRFALGTATRNRGRTSRCHGCRIDGGSFVGDSWLACAFGVGLALAAMQITRTVHAPAGADPLIVIVAHAPVSYLISPVLVGSLVIVLTAWAVNNLRSPGSYQSIGSERPLL